MACNPRLDDTSELNAFLDGLNDSSCEVATMPDTTETEQDLPTSAIQKLLERLAKKGLKYDSRKQRKGDLAETGQLQELLLAALRFSELQLEAVEGQKAALRKRELEAERMQARMEQQQALLEQAKSQIASAEAKHASLKDQLKSTDQDRRREQRHSEQSSVKLKQREDQWKHKLRRAELENVELRDKLQAAMRKRSAAAPPGSSLEQHLPFLDHIPAQEQVAHPMSTALEATISQLITENQQLNDQLTRASSSSSSSVKSRSAAVSVQKTRPAKSAMMI